MTARTVSAWITRSIGAGVVVKFPGSGVFTGIVAIGASVIETAEVLTDAGEVRFPVAVIIPMIETATTVPDMAYATPTARFIVGLRY